jgi:hypothetical protein
MDKFTEKLYKEYKSHINLDGLEHSVQYEMTTALINKSLKTMWLMLQNAKETGKPDRLISLYESKTDALIALVADLTVTCIELFLQEEGKTE